MKENTLKVLLIEDDEDDFLLTSELLEEVEGTHYEIVWVSKFSNALAAILEGSHDVCLVDYRLGEGTGIELIKAAKARGCHLPMILLTGQGGKEIDIEATEAGAADYLIKGKVEAQLLERSIRYALANSKILKDLRESENRFRSVIESASDAIVLTDGRGTILSWNDSARRIFEYARAEAVGQPISFLFPLKHCGGESGIAPLLAAGLLRSENHVVEMRGVRKNNIEFPLEISLSSWGTAEETFYCGIIRDITERKSLEDQLHRAQKLESIGQLAAGIAHEINTPTQYVGDNIRFLKDSFHDFITVLEKNERLLETYQSDPAISASLIQVKEAMEQADVEFLVEEVPKAVEQALHGVERISKIVQSMKDFAHPGSLDKKATDLNRAIESTITIASNEWKYVANMVTDYDNNLPAVPCLIGEFNQVILNMIINSVHAIADVVGDGSRGKGTITVSTRHYGDWAEIRVSDTGAGIPQEIRRKIFDPFFTTKEVGKGSGQGLAISHAVIVEKHKGTINVESEPGKGTTFIIGLPINETAAQPKPAA